MTTKTTYKVGDKVRILNANAIMACEAKDGDILEVIDVEASVIPRLRDVDGEGLCILGSELKYIEKVAEQVAKFKVGDKVRVTNDNHEHKKGDVRVINRIGSPSGSFDYGLKGGGYIKECNIELATQKPTKNQRITALEQTVADLQAEVEALKAAQKLPTMTVKSDVDVAKIAESLAKAFEKCSPKSPNEQASANEQRKAIIAEAKAFVEDAKNFTGSISGRSGYRYEATNNICSDVEFVVNAEKRTVVALLTSQMHRMLRSKAIAKCAPDDVFNADIGKAIALGRALGLDVSKFEKAVQPSQIVVGQSFKVTQPGLITGKTVEITKLRPCFDGMYGKAFNHTYDSGWLGQEQGVITDDTEAQY